MRTRNIFALIVAVSLLASCNPAGTSSRQYDTETAILSDNGDYKILAVVGGYFASHSDVLNNEISKDRDSKEIQKIVFDSIRKDPTYLQELPFQYSTAIRKGDKYIVKFALSHYNDNRCENGYYSVSCDLFAIVSEDVMMSLKDGNYYNVSGKFKGDVTNKITLPSGRAFQQNPSIINDGSVTIINLGGLYIENLEVSPFASSCSTPLVFQ